MKLASIEADVFSPKKIWDFETVDYSEEYIVYNGTRYVTQLPFKPDRGGLPDNYNVSKTCLKNLTKRLKCNEVVKEYREDKKKTKLIAVFYVSCSSIGPLLNDCLYSDQNI